MLQEKSYPTGGQFLLEATDPDDVFTPEDFDETQRMIADTVREFYERSVKPHTEAYEYGKDKGLNVAMIKAAGEAGLLSVDVPEAYGGMGADKATVMLVAEGLAWSGSFNVTHGAHSGIGTLPIVYFGTDEQKAKYLPRLATGEIIGAYALTEPGSGSDALAAATTAVLDADGKHYLLNGSKQYITNAGFADLFIVFAKVGGRKFTAFIVERDTPGLSIGAEERKMGIKGSSTCPMVFENAPVPVGNVLGEIGRGHVVAFNILNVGRFKLGAGTVGGCKVTLEAVVPYVKQRQQFGKPLSDFGLIRAKLADIAARTFVAESMVYRTAGLIDRAIAGLDHADPHYDRTTVETIEEFTIECSMIKVFGSEVLAFAADEGLQSLGGYGFCEDYPPGEDLPRREDQPDLRRDQRDQPDADSRHAASQGAEEAARVLPGSEKGRRRTARAARLCRTGRARIPRERGEARRVHEKDDARDSGLRRAKGGPGVEGTAGGALRRGRHRHRDLRVRIRPVARLQEGEAGRG